MSWFGFFAVCLLFLVSHSLPTRPAIKQQISRVTGPRGFTIGYSVFSLVMLWLLIRAAALAPFLELWPQGPALRGMTQLGMLLLCLYFALALGRPNPFSFGGARNESFDPARPGIVRLHRHPLLLGLAFWAMLHLLPNGDLAHVLLFGVLGSFALLGMKLIDRRKQRDLGAAQWQVLLDEVRHAPLRSGFAQQGQLARLLLGLMAYLMILFAHALVIGVPAV